MWNVCSRLPFRAEGSYGLNLWLLPENTLYPEGKANHFKKYTDASGDVPVLGALFTSQEYISGQTELVIFVTPHLAKPIAPDKVALPTDSYMAPSDLEFYLLGKLQASAQTVDGSASSVTASESATVIGPSGGLDAGKYGHGF